MLKGNDIDITSSKRVKKQAATTTHTHALCIHVLQEVHGAGEVNERVARPAIQPPGHAQDKTHTPKGAPADTKKVQFGAHRHFRCAELPKARGIIEAMGASPGHQGGRMTKSLNVCDVGRKTGHICLQDDVDEHGEHVICA